MAVSKIDGKKFREVIGGSGKTVVVDFYADWCMPCKMLSPVLDQVSNEKTDAEFYKLNIDENPDLAAEYSVMSIPYVVSFRNGKVYKKAIGVHPKNALADLVE